MTRVEELTLALADGTIAPEEREELDRLLADDPEARRSHLLTLEMELGLRARRARVDVEEAVMAVVASRSEARVLDRVMTEIASRPAPAPPPVRRRRWAAPVALAAAAGLLFAWRAGRAPERNDETARETAAWASVAHAQGTVSATAAGARRPLRPGDALDRGERVETAEGASAELRLGGSRLALGPGSLVDLDAAPRVARGTLVAEVAGLAAGARLAFATPHAIATVLGTRFRLEVTAEETRLEVEEGRVLFERLADGSALAVAAGERAAAGAAVAAEALARARAQAQEGAPGEARAAAPGPVLAFDFESGVLPPSFYNGVLAPAPPRPGSRHAIMGGVNVYGPHTNTVAAHGKPLARYSADLVLRFDYWLGADGEFVEIVMWSPDRRQNYKARIGDVVHERWAHAEVRLTDLLGERRRAVRMQEGDQIENFLIQGGRMGGQPFYVDDIELVAVPADRP